MNPELRKVLEDFSVGLYNVEATGEELPKFIDKFWQQVTSYLKGYV